MILVHCVAKKSLIMLARELSSSPMAIPAGKKNPDMSKEAKCVDNK
jgi:hypothetical protein